MILSWFKRLIRLSYNGEEKLEINISFREWREKYGRNND